MEGNVLLLNASFQPLTAISIQRAMTLILGNKAEYVTQDDSKPIRSPSTSFPWPVVIRLLSYIKVPRRSSIGLTRRALYARDNYTCQYNDCTSPADTIDHVIPKSRKGPSSWGNLTSACSTHNRLKGSKLLSELGWTLKVEPKAPSGVVWLVLGHRKQDPRWKPWLE